MRRIYPRKRDLVELMTGLGIVEKYEGKWYVTHEFRKFVAVCHKKIAPAYFAMRAKAPEIDKDTVGILAMVLEWDRNISEEDAIEATTFLEYWATFGVCPFDRYGSEPVGVV